MLTQEVDIIGIHRTHCCALHGCKYGNSDCPVKYLSVVQEGPCEECADWMTDEPYRDIIECLIESRRGDEPWEAAGVPWSNVAECVHLYLDLRSRNNGREYRMVARTVTPWRPFGQRWGHQCDVTNTWPDSRRSPRESSPGSSRPKRPSGRRT